LFHHQLAFIFQFGWFGIFKNGNQLRKLWLLEVPEGI